MSGLVRTIMSDDSGDTADLLEQARRGDASARHELLARYRKRLKKMVAVRMDPRLAARVDSSSRKSTAVASNGEENAIRPSSRQRSKIGRCHSHGVCALS